MKTVLVSGSFDNLVCRHVRLLHEASRLGRVHVALWSDDAVEATTGRPPKFPLAERRYMVGALRFVDSLDVTGEARLAETPPATPGGKPDLWAMMEEDLTIGRRAAAKERGITLRTFSEEELADHPILPPQRPSGRKKVMVTGCYDWFHSGHVRFFEEVSGLGDLHVVVGSDANVKLLKGQGHPLFSEGERSYLVGSVRFVTQSLVSTGTGWMDAAPEVERIRPDFYVVNEDGDKPEKREFCRMRGIEYVVLKRTPREGLVGRFSTKLRGF
jgi:cytidyltransferase-like protein